MKASIEKIKRQIKKLENKLYNLEIEEQKLKEINCKNHDFEFYCTCHNDNAYKCIKCGKKEYR